jgi:hypothetical protein
VGWMPHVAITITMLWTSAISRHAFLRNKPMMVTSCCTDACPFGNDREPTDNRDNLLRHRGARTFSRLVEANLILHVLHGTCPANSMFLFNGALALLFLLSSRHRTHLVVCPEAEMYAQPHVSHCLCLSSSFRLVPSSRLQTMQEVVLPDDE